MKFAFYLTHILVATSTEDSGQSIPIPQEVQRIEHENADRAGETTEHLATEEEAKEQKLDEVSPEHIAAPHADVGEVTPLETETKSAFAKAEKKEEKKLYNGQNHMGSEYVPAQHSQANQHNATVGTPVQSGPALSEVAEQQQWYREQAREELSSEQKEVQAAIDLLREKNKNINEQLKDTEAKNSNLNDISFDLLNTTNHVVIDLTLTRGEQQEMEPEVPAAPGLYHQERTHQNLPKYDANQQAVICMLQDISYVCIGKGVRKCCSVESVSDEQCINTEQYYHGVKLDPFDEYSENDRTFQGTNAEYVAQDPLLDLPTRAPVDPAQDPDADLDQSTIEEGGQTKAQVNFNHSQILMRDGALVHPDNVLCSDSLRDTVSFYSQFELAPTFEEVCGSKYLNSTMVEKFIMSQDLAGDLADTDQFTKYSMCMYEIINPWPTHTLYLNIYRQTNNTDIGIYFEKSNVVAEAHAKKSPLMPKGTKETFHEYVPGEWKQDATVPIESNDINNYFQTLKVQYPPRDDFYFDMSDHMKAVGAPYHNVSDILRQYTIEGVDKVKIVVIGQDLHSQFDIGYQVGLFTTQNKQYFENNWGYFALALVILLALYMMLLSVMYGVKSNKKYQEFD